MNYWWKVEGGEGQGIMEIDSKLCGLVKIDGRGVVMGRAWSWEGCGRRRGLTCT